ncbi:AraC family ligand binding domain-containing protein [Paenibacillus doosanensis]|uniref:HTH-type transcriptional activator Btr n=1 Tax=Paenibacillus konkukensis TaxID=2020716 RepID=A0ABY4RP50_9BACL|nr:MULTISPECIES: AraC family ligand binding domain-containing protein [Paenibacillus]MCS7459164.1 AraC family ligand binding domain-containing protein [Paenibacillus doosanensis]UQZ84222.1 HTH-type transcriptional activator Btr [Paenibacillus konkukensis]
MYARQSIEPPLTHEEKKEEFMIMLKEIEPVKGAGGWEMEPRFTESQVLVAVASGQGRLLIGNRSCLLRQDRVYAVPPGETYGASADPAEGLGLFLLRFDVYRPDPASGEVLRVEPGDSLLLGRGEIPFSSAAGSAALCQTIHSLWQSADRLERFRAQMLFQELLYTTMKASGRTEEDSLSALERARDYMKTHYQHNLSIEQLTRLADISPKYFVDLFKKLMKRSFC